MMYIYFLTTILFLLSLFLSLILYLSKFLAFNFGFSEKWSHQIAKTIERREEEKKTENIFRCSLLHPLFVQFLCECDWECVCVCVCKQNEQTSERASECESVGQTRKTCHFIMISARLVLSIFFVPEIICL